MKSLKTISWEVDEETYRSDSAIRYSTLSTFARDGAKAIPHLADKKSGKALRFGSLIDCIITKQSLDERFVIADIPKLSENVIKIIKALYNQFGATYPSILNIPKIDMLALLNLEAYSSNLKDDTRVKSIIEKGEEYYNLLNISQEKVIVSNEEYYLAVNCADVLKNHPFTREYFNINPFNTTIEKLFQLKFKIHSELYEDLKCMLDLIIVDHENKIIIPCDLKTTGKEESAFNSSFLMWRYDLQASLYCYILKEVCNQDDYFKDFTILPFRFIVINKENRAPIIWICEDSIEESISKKDRSGNVYKPWPVLLNELKWHIKEKVYDYPKNIYLTNGVTHLDKLTTI